METKPINIFPPAPPDVLCFGCIGTSGAGHQLRSRTLPHLVWDSTPWDRLIDGGLAPRRDCVTGEYVEHHKDGWTAVAFWDRSGDSRPGSNTVFLVATTVTGAELLSAAREQWPAVFARPGFPTLTLLPA